MGTPSSRCWRQSTSKSSSSLLPLCKWLELVVTSSSEELPQRRLTFGNFRSRRSFKTRPSSHHHCHCHCQMTGVNICPNICPQKSETVYPLIWGIPKLSVMRICNKIILKTVFQNFQTVSEQEQKSIFSSKNIISHQITLLYQFDRDRDLWVIYHLGNLICEMWKDFSTYHSTSVWSKTVHHK